MYCVEVCVIAFLIFFVVGREFRCGVRFVRWFLFWLGLCLFLFNLVFHL